MRGLSTAHCIAHVHTPRQHPAQRVTCGGRQTWGRCLCLRGGGALRAVPCSHRALFQSRALHDTSRGSHANAVSRPRIAPHATRQLAIRSMRSVRHIASASAASHVPFRYQTSLRRHVGI
eukprot:2308001-Rhodomonas_salina.1